MRTLSFAAALLYFAKLGQQADITELAEDLDFRFIQGKSVINENDHCMSVKFCRETLLGRKADDNGVKALSSYVLSNSQVTP